VSFKLVLLAAGRGSRLGNLTYSKPKCLNEFRGIPLLQHILDTAEKFDFEEVVIVGGYKSDLLHKYGKRVLKNIDWESSGPFASLMVADDIMIGSNVVVSYTDIFFGEDFFESCLDSNCDIYLPNNASYVESWNDREVDMLEDLETFKYKENLLVEIGQKPNSVDEIQGQFAGIFKLTPAGWSQLKEIGIALNNPKLDITTLLREALNRKVKINTSEVKSFWKEFDLPSDFG